MSDVKKMTLKTTWNGATKGDGRIAVNALDTAVAIPQPMGGSGAGANPKDLLVASAAACYSMTLVVMLEGRKIPAEGLTMNTEVSDAKDAGIKIDHQLEIVLSVSATQEQVQAAQAAIPKADAACAIGNMLRKAGVQIGVQGTVARNPVGA